MAIIVGTLLIAVNYGDKLWLDQLRPFDWLTETGNFVILNNGIEFAATYSIMFLVLFFIGAGRYASLDYWIARRFFQKQV